MQDAWIAARFRALRHRLRWRQDDLATRAGVSQHVISLIERGRLEEVALAKIRRVARELDADFAPQLRWRGGDLDRLVDEMHARLLGRVVALLSGVAWQCRVEVSYSVYGERGSIDVLAWHPATATLLVVEVKTELVSIEETLRKHDEKARLAARIAAEQPGWKARHVARLLVLPSISTARRRVDRHGAVIAAAYPMGGSHLRAWLATPTAAETAGMLFIGAGPGAGPAADQAARKRIRCGPRGREAPPPRRLTTSCRPT